MKIVINPQDTSRADAFNLWMSSPMPMVTFTKHITFAMNMEKKHNCQQCPLRQRYDKNPKSLLGRFWRWHINFCPGWKAYFTSLSEEEQNWIRAKYGFNKYNDK